MKPIVIITGGSSGIGKELALAYAKHQYQVFTLSRRAHKWNLPNMQHLICDVTKSEDLALVAEKFKDLSCSHVILICCAGYGIAGATENTSLSEAKAQFDVNFFGVFLTIQHFLPLLKRHKNSKVLFISSVASEISLPFQSFYSASKAAANKLLEAWQLELKPYGIQFSSFLLGDIQSDFTQNRQRIKELSKEYEKRVYRSISKMENDEKNGMQPSFIADVIFRRSQKRKMPPIQTIGGQYHFFLLLQRLLPRKFVLFLVGRLYAK